MEIGCPVLAARDYDAVGNLLMLIGSWQMTEPDPSGVGEDRYGTVIKGTWYTGAGDEFAPDKTIPLKPGSFTKHPAGVHHFDGAKDEEVIVQISGVGPRATIPVDESGRPKQ